MSKPIKIMLWFGLSIVLIIIFYACIEWIHVHRGISYGDLTRDPNAIHNSPKYIGLLSQTGMVFWFGTTGILLFTATIIIKKKFPNNIIYFLSNALLLTFFLGIDDLFMLHDELSHRGISEEYFYIFYGIWLLATLIYFRKIIKNTYHSLILVYGSVFALSIIIDKTIEKAYLLEDMLKFLGIINWAFYWSTTAYLLLVNQKKATDS